MVGRTFSILDAMVLVAATAAGVKVISLWVVRPENILDNFRSFQDGALLVRFVAGSLAFYWAVAVVLLRLRRPRPPLRSIGRQPGFVACYSVVLAFLASVSIDGYTLVNPRRDRWDIMGNMLVGLMAVQYIAPAVTLAWLVLLISRGWEPEPSWLDRLGRGIGALWIAMYLETIIEVYWRALS